MKPLELIKNVIIEPVKHIKARYVPLLLVYAAYAASGVTGIAETFWVKKSLTLTAEQLILLGVYATIPWTIKFVLGHMVDTIKIFNSQRKIYISLGAILMAASYVLLAAVAGEYSWIAAFDKNAVYISCSIMLSTAFCIQDIVADTMSTEVVDRVNPDGTPRKQEDIDTDLSLIQYLGRLSFAFSAFIVAGLGGLLASKFSYDVVFLCGLAIPLMTMIGVCFIRLDKTNKQKPNLKVLFGGLGFACFSIFMGINDFQYGQEIIFSISLAIVSYLLYMICKPLVLKTRKLIMFAILTIFCYQGTPGGGPGIGWWYQDVLKFDEAFFGILNQTSAALSLLGMWVLVKWIKGKQVGSILFLLTIINLVLSLPIIGLSMGLQDWTQEHFGFGARTIALVDTAAAGPFAILSSVSLTTLVAMYAPKGSAGMFFALCTSLMNLSLNFSGLCTKYLYKIYPIERGVYDNVQEVLISTTVIGTIVPIVAILIFMNPFKTKVILDK